MGSALTVHGVRRDALIRLGVLAGLAVLAASMHVSHRPPTLCPFRALTGLPCPVCGSTTAAVDVGRGDLVAAVRANPVTLAGAGVLVAAPLGLAAWWRRLPVRIRTVVTVAVVIAAELWQLHRFGFLA